MLLQACFPEVLNDLECDVWHFLKQIHLGSVRRLRLKQDEEDKLANNIYEKYIFFLFNLLMLYSPWTVKPCLKNPKKGVVVWVDGVTPHTIYLNFYFHLFCSAGYWTQYRVGRHCTVEPYPHPSLWTFW